MRRVGVLLAVAMLGLAGSAQAAPAPVDPLGRVITPAVAVRGEADVVTREVQVVDISGRQVTLRLSLAGWAGTVLVDDGRDGRPDGELAGQPAIDSVVVRVDGIAVPARASLQTSSSEPGRSSPKVAMLVLDTSGSMDGVRIDTARQAASAFIEGLPADVAVGLVAFADSARLALAPTTDRQVVLDAIENLQAGGDTALHDAIALAAASVPSGSKAGIILLSDGADTSSSLRLAAALSSAREQGSPIDVIALQPTDEERAILTRIAAVNKGRLLTAVEVDELGAAFDTAGASFADAAIVTAEIPGDLDAQRAPVTVSARIAGVPVTGSTTLPDDPGLAAEPAAALVAQLPPAIVLPSTDPAWLALGIAAFLAVLAPGLAWIAVDRRRRRNRRVQQLAPYQVAAAPVARSGHAGWVDRTLDRAGGAGSMRTRLAAAEIALRPGSWLLVRIGISLALALVGALLLGWLVGGILGLVSGWLSTWAVVRARSSRRQQSFSNELPDFLLLLASGLRGGLSFNHALEAVALDGKGEVPRQMRRVLRQVQVGTMLDEALLECADRMDSEDLRWTVTALSIQREVGGNLSTILDNAAATIKSREELRREVRTLSAEGRLSGYILIGLPLGVLAFLAIIRRSYVELLWTTGLGVVMLCLMGALMVLGWFWMRAIVRIKP